MKMLNQLAPSLVQEEEHGYTIGSGILISLLTFSKVNIIFGQFGPNHFQYNYDIISLFQYFFLDFHSGP